MPWSTPRRVSSTGASSSAPARLAASARSRSRRRRSSCGPPARWVSLPRGSRLDWRRWESARGGPGLGTRRSRRWPRGSPSARERSVALNAVAARLVDSVGAGMQPLSPGSGRSWSRSDGFRSWRRRRTRGGSRSLRRCRGDRRDRTRSCGPSPRRRWRSTSGRARRRRGDGAAANVRAPCAAVAEHRRALLSLPRGGEVDGTPALGPCSMTMRVEPPMGPTSRRTAARIRCSRCAPSLFFCRFRFRQRPFQGFQALLQTRDLALHEAHVEEGHIFRRRIQGIAIAQP